LVDVEQIEKDTCTLQKLLPIYFPLPPQIFDVVDIELSIYLGRHPSPSPLLSPDVLADVDVVDLKLSTIKSDCLFKNIVANL
jgi:hypothetical protein